MSLKPVLLFNGIALCLLFFSNEKETRFKHVEDKFIDINNYSDYRNSKAIITYETDYKNRIKLHSCNRAFKRGFGNYFEINWAGEEIIKLSNAASSSNKN